MKFQGLKFQRRISVQVYLQCASARVHLRRVPLPCVQAARALDLLRPSIQCTHKQSPHEGHPWARDFGIDQRGANLVSWLTMNEWYAGCLAACACPACSMIRMHLRRLDCDCELLAQASTVCCKACWQSQWCVADDQVDH